MLPGVFPDKVTPDIDFTDVIEVKCDAPLVKLLLWVLVYKLSQMNFDVNIYILFLDPVFCIVLDS